MVRNKFEQPTGSQKPHTQNIGHIFLAYYDVNMTTIHANVPSPLRIAAKELPPWLQARLGVVKPDQEVMITTDSVSHQEKVEKLLHLSQQSSIQAYENGLTPEIAQSIMDDR